MESALSTLILFAVGLFAAVTISFTHLETQDRLWTSEQARQEALIERARTDLSVLTADTQSSGSIVRVILRNTGQVKLADFDRWDVVVQYYSSPDDNDYVISWLPYSSGLLGNQQWTVVGIYRDATTLAGEVFEPGILNPGEEMIINIRLQPPVPLESTNLVSISTANGIGVTTGFTR